MITLRLHVDRAAARALPRQIYPHATEAEYASHLVRIVGQARFAYESAVDLAVSLLAAENRERGDSAVHTDASRRQQAEAAIDRGAMRVRIGNGEIDSLARKYADQTQRHNRAQLGRQIKAAVGVDPKFRDGNLGAMVDRFATENVRLVSKIATGYHAELRDMVTDAFARGRGHDVLAKEIGERFDIGERHARLIARDQIGKLNAKVNEARQREVGITRFVWRTVGDERVRPEHEDLDGKDFAYDDPPDEGLPGEPVCCRCSAEPVFDDDGDD